jgi:hypothetical protein
VRGWGREAPAYSIRSYKSNIGQEIVGMIIESWYYQDRCMGGRMKGYLEVAKAAAVKAGTILREHIGGIREVSYKGEINLVTEMDRLSERTIVDTILSRPTQGSSGS